MATAAEKKKAEADAKAAEEKATRERAEADARRDGDNAGDGTTGINTPDLPDPVQDADGDYVTPNTGTVHEPVVTPPETYKDNRGIERLAGGFDDGWEPAPVDPDPELVKQNEGRLQAIEDAKKDRDERIEAKKTEAEKASESDSKDKDKS